MANIEISQERFLLWFKKILNSSKPSVGLEMLFDLGLLQIFAPLLHQERTAFAALFKNLDLTYSPEIKTALPTKLAFLFHLPKAQRENELLALEFDRAIIDQAAIISGIFDTFLAYRSHFEKETGYYARYFLAKLKNEAPNEDYPPFLAQIQSFLAMWDPDCPKILASILHQPVIGQSDIPLKGRDIMDLGIPPGPRIKNLLWQAHNHVLKHPEQNNAPDLIAYLKGYLSSN